ncbi:Txe/YoeB family toxin of Txe-Axe toxin-antitoxin module [Bradyrhizobium diazoefficiens]
MLLERTSKLVDEIAQFEKLKRSAGEAKSLQTRAEQLAPVAEKLVASADVVAKIRMAGIAVPFVPKEGDTLSKRATGLLNELREDPNNLVNPSIDIRFDFVDRLLHLAQAAEKASLDAWRRHLDTISENAPEEILTALASIADYRSTVERIRSLQKRVSQLAEAVPPDPVASIDEIKRLAAEHREIWERMTAGGIPADVIDFLRACGFEGAPLGSFTSGVEAWLRERGLIHLFRVKLR